MQKGYDKTKYKDTTLLPKEVQSEAVKRKRHQICSKIVCYKSLFHS